jgi:outer membrane receptor protein involved in Fe transport
VSKGIELSIQAAPVKGFDFSLAYGYTHATFISNVVSPTVNYNDNFLPYVPRHTAALQGGKTFTLRNSAILDDIRVSASYRGVGEIYWNENNVQKQPYYGLVDAKISFMRRSFQLDIWTKNFLNKIYSSFYFEALGNKYAQAGKPMQIGMNLSVKF